MNAPSEDDDKPEKNQRGIGEDGEGSSQLLDLLLNLVNLWLGRNRPRGLCAVTTFKSEEETSARHHPLSAAGCSSWRKARPFLSKTYNPSAF
jgi:hypothetical protein